MIIHIKDLNLNIIIGILEHERNTEQHVIVNAKIWYHYDCETGYLDYMGIVESLRDMLEVKCYKLLEDALNDLAQHIFLQFQQVYKIKLTLTKTQICKDCLISVSQTYTK